MIRNLRSRRFFVEDGESRIILQTDDICDAMVAHKSTPGLGGKVWRSEDFALLALKKPVMKLPFVVARFPTAR